MPLHHPPSHSYTALQMMSDQGPYTVPISVGSSTIGGPIYFTEGPFAGKTIRTSATELQKADVGRKYARRDKRPLDPPPVVQVRFFEVLNAGTSRQYEKEITVYDDRLTLGFLCQAELFPVGADAGPDGSTRDRVMTDLLATGSSTNFTSSRVGASEVPQALSLRSLTIAPPYIPASGWQDPGAAIQPSNNAKIIAYYGNYPIRESSNSTAILAGAHVASPITTSHNNGRVLLFVFSDLAVQQEGTFTLRYCVFDIFSKTTVDGGLSHRAPVLASCFGGVFKVWSTKTFPGLPSSTELTRRLSLLGAPVNIRSADHKIGKGRKKRKTSHSRSPADGGSSFQGQPGGSEMVCSPEERIYKLGIDPGWLPMAHAPPRSGALWEWPSGLNVEQVQGSRGL
ncbi:hypothetical protein L226DRAFT_531879 [Lentinus tigrinus ALCF2SS1-7]|uniref:uncharacterized protein n=1 Tax=Lentinus tigrinus ALCF2SS1-7 TaxID=1328758 RepID=UPI0011663BF7|nr:hypothetical protein L226DRAFT_531879 [Lentinus tigrinus ALCF2SS1-7]